MENIAKSTSYGCYLDCDFETAKYPDDKIHIVGLLAEYVYDLEQRILHYDKRYAKLWNEIETLRECVSNDFDQDEKIADLEAKLEESETRIEELKGERLKFYTDDVRRTQVINGVHFDIEQLLVFSEYVEHEKWVIAENDKEIKELKQQLAEKDEKIEKLKSENHALMSDNAYQEADIFELDSFKEYYKNNKISFAVEKLEKVKEKLRQNITITAPEGELKKLKDYLIGVDNFIDNQIKQLKEME